MTQILAEIQILGIEQIPGQRICCGPERPAEEIRRQRVSFRFEQPELQGFGR